MRNTLIALTLACLAPAASAQVSAQVPADVMTPIRQFIDGFNKGDVPSALAACADQAFVIDEIPPYEWSGAGACGKWASDYDADAKKKGITAGAVTMGMPRHHEVSGDRAYVVIPTSYEVTQKGKQVKQTGAVMAVTLRKGASGWKITAWSWSTGSIR
jgi:ketosteroid isomerase-like protein